MKIQRVQKDNCVLLRLMGPVTIDHVDKLHQEILFAMADSKELVLDLSTTTECDATALQIFYAAYLHAQKEEKKFKIEKPSPEAIDALIVGGFSHTPLYDSSDADSTAA